MVYSLVYFFWHEESVETCHRSETCGAKILIENRLLLVHDKKKKLRTHKMKHLDCYSLFLQEEPNRLLICVEY